MSVLQSKAIGKWLILIFSVISFFGVAWWLALGKNHANQNNVFKKVTIAIPTQVCVGALFVGADQKIFDAHELNVTLQPFALGKQALQSVLDDKADLAILADTPFMFSIMNGDKIATVGTIFGSRKTMAIVARKDRGITQAEDLPGKKIGTIFKSNAQYFVDALLVAHSVPKSSVTIVFLTPDELVDALKKGDVDAVTVWHPNLAKLQQALGDHAAIISGKDIFIYRFILVGKQDYLDTHPAEIRQVLAAMEESTQFIHENPAQSQRIIGKALEMDASLLSQAFDPNDFSLSLDQTLLLALSDETRWAMKQGLIPPGPIPNYLNYIRQEPLESVLPSAIKIIR